MFDLLSNAAPFIGWSVIAAVALALALALVASYVVWLILDFVGRYIACNAFAHKAHWHKPEDTPWERTQRTASIAWHTLWTPGKSFHSKKRLPDRAGLSPSPGAGT